MLVVSPQKIWRMTVTSMFVARLQVQCSELFVVQREMAIRKSNRSAPEPDLSIVRASAALDRDKSVYLPEEVVLVAEVVSPESEKRDHQDKPEMYAAMGIPSFWLLERGKDNAPIVHGHHLAGDEYRLVRTHIDRLTTETPFAIDFILAAPTARGSS
jgi:Uma2 family endonuclease